MNSKNKYWTEALKFKASILGYVKQILKVYGNELVLKIEEWNLLKNENNCIESSTAIGYCIEEFLVSKLITYTKNNDMSNGEYIISRDNVNTQSSSFDCYSYFDNSHFLINIKVDKNNNNAVAAIQQLYNDYVINKPNEKKHFMILKIYYSIGVGKANEKKILIRDIGAFFLEEINFLLGGHKQDHRNWSSNFNANSGRLQITQKFLKDNLMNREEISYEATKKFLTDIFLKNKN